MTETRSTDVISFDKAIATLYELYDRPVPHRDFVASKHSSERIQEVIEFLMDVRNEKRHTNTDADNIRRAEEFAEDLDIKPKP